MTKTADEVRETMKKYKDKKGSGKDKWMKLEDGDRSFLRLGPPWTKEGEFWKEVLTHGYFKDKVYCRKNDINEKTGKKKKCIVCLKVKEVNEGKRTYLNKKLWSLLKQNVEFLWNAAKVAKKRTNEEGVTQARKYEDNKFKILRLSNKWNNLLLDIFADEDFRRKSILGVTHPKYGRLIKAKREGGGRDDTTYSFYPDGAMTPLLPTKEKRQKMLKTLVDLDAEVHGSSEEELAAFIAKMEKKARKMVAKDNDKGDEEDDEEEDVDDEEDDDEPKKKNKRDKDEDDDDDESSLEKEYKKLEKKLKKKKSKSRDEDDDDTEDDDDE